jgi:hypothetical protein
MSSQFQTMSQVIAEHKRRDGHWFDKDAMRFFDSKIESPLIEGRYFVSSEQCHHSDGTSSPRLFTVREVSAEADIDTVGEFQGYKTKRAARAAIYALLGAAD